VTAPSPKTPASSISSRARGSDGLSSTGSKSKKGVRFDLSGASPTKRSKK